jgi:hypothetical protein
LAGQEQMLGRLEAKTEVNQERMEANMNAGQERMLTSMDVCGEKLDKTHAAWKTYLEKRKACKKRRSRIRMRIQNK